MSIMRQKKHHSDTYNPVILRAINIAGGTAVSLAEKAKISQNAVWKLLHGKSKCAKYKTAEKLEIAVNGEISRYDFMRPAVFISAEASKTEIKKNNENKELTSMNAVILIRCPDITAAYSLIIQGGF